MKEYNAIEAARILGISDKTIRRHIQKGTIEASRKASGELKIAEDQLDKLRRVLELESESGHEQTRLEGMSRQIEELTARVSELETRLVHLESRQSQPQATEKPEKLYRFAVDKSDVQPQQSPQIDNVGANITIPSDIPQGSLLFSDFAARHQVKRATMWRHCTSGIQGDTVKTTEKPKPGGRPGDKERILNKSQQDAAIAFWKRHNVIFSRCEDEFCDCHG